ncbi:MAG: hypothetical protein HY046_06520 [Acidobacteria bacterium]|nr:hypothetical protein [Acidobacteriota bacterium]
MSTRSITPSAGNPAKIDLQVYLADLQFTTLTIGVDNLHYDVFLSNRFADFTRKYLLDLLRQSANLASFYGSEWKSFKSPETGAFKKHLLELLQNGLTHAKYEKNIELDLLLRAAVWKFLIQETAAQFLNLVLECKEFIRARGEYFERSEQAHVAKALLAEMQASRPHVIRKAGQQVFQILYELEDNTVARSRRALFGEEFRDTYDLFRNRLLFVEGGRDDYLFLENYVLLGNFVRDTDRFETFDALFIEFLRDFVLSGQGGEEVGVLWKNYEQLSDKALSHRAELSRLEEERSNLLRQLEQGDNLLNLLSKKRDPSEIRAALKDVQKRHDFLEQKLQELNPLLEVAKAKVEQVTEAYQSRMGDFLNQPENARRLFDEKWTGNSTESKEVRARLLEEWIHRMEQRDLLVSVIAAYELRNIHLDYCPPVHLQQLKKALVSREELKRVEDIVKQFPARRFALGRLEDLAKSLRRYPQDQVHGVALRFAEDFMRLRRDLRNYQRMTALMERINLIRVERTRELSRMNNSLYEFLLSGEARPAEDKILSHVIIKADVRGSTKMTQELLARGLNPASHLSLNLYEPMRRILDRYGAAKVFIEGDAIILAIYETESNRESVRAVAKACLLGSEILGVARTYNNREESKDLPRLELGVGVAYQNSPPTYWMDSDSKIMISKAINLSDRLSSCAKVAKRLLGEHKSPFRLFLFQTMMDAALDEEIEEVLIRYNLNGVQLNEEGFAKLSAEISLSPVEREVTLPWGKEKVQLFVGEVPIGESLEKIVLRKGMVRQLLPGGKIGEPGTYDYYEVCSNPEVLAWFSDKPAK